MDPLIRAIKLASPDKVPVSVSILPAAFLHHGAELVRLTNQYPQFFPHNMVDPEQQNIRMPETYHAGRHVDEWGCLWDNIQEGMESIVTHHPVNSAEDVFSLEIPSNRDGRLPHGFMYLRLLDLCGFELAMELFAEEGEALRMLIDKVLTYNLIQVEAALPRMGEMAYLGDDLGMQTGLAIGPKKWRKYLMPCYEQIFGLIKRKKPGTLVYMHTDGCIHEIMGNLQDSGADMINPQFRANGIDNLVRVCRKERIIPINLDLDRQLFPWGTRSQLTDHVAECVEALYLREGALGLSAEFNFEIPLENMAAVLDALDKYQHYRG